MTPAPAAHDGLDLERLLPWFEEHVAPFYGKPRVLPVTGGRSNLTFELRDRRRSWILRRPPLGHVLATAHDMRREYRAMAALAGTAVPVPEVYVLCDDPSVIGAQFYVMELMAGTAYRTRDQLEQLGHERVRGMALTLVETLAELHALAPAELPLEGFGRPEGYLERQVSRWRRQLASSHSRDLPGADELFDWLGAHTPATSRAAVVHGDYRIDNALFDGPRLTAVIDWEMATLGDPLTDLAMLLVYQNLPRLPDGERVFDATAAEGYLDDAETLEVYARLSGAELGDVGFYLALAHAKLAVIYESIYFRGLELPGAADDIPSSALVVPLIEAALDARGGLA